MILNRMAPTIEQHLINIHSHNKTHTRVRVHHMVTTSIRHTYQQTTQNTALIIATGYTTDTTSTRRNTHFTHEGTPPATRITDKTKIATPHTPTTLHHNKQHPDVRNKQHTITQTLTQTPTP